MTSEHTTNLTNVEDPFKHIVIITDGNPVFSGLFGELQGEDNDKVLMQLDPELKSISTALEAYGTQAYGVRKNDVIIVPVPSQAHYNSLKASLCHMNAQKWNKQYDGLKSRGDDFMRVALEHEQNKMNQAVETVIANTGAQKEMMSIALVGIPDVFSDEDERDMDFVCSLLSSDGLHRAQVIVAENEGGSDDQEEFPALGVSLRLGQVGAFVDLSDGHSKEDLLQFISRSISESKALERLYLQCMENRYVSDIVEIDPQTAFELLVNESNNPLSEDSLLFGVLEDLAHTEQGNTQLPRNTP